MKTPRDLSGDDLIATLKLLGYSPTRQTGSHVQLVTKLHGEHHVTIPRHYPLRIGTLNQIFNLVGHHFGLTKQELLEKLKL